jgi:hypothetical protein
VLPPDPQFDHANLYWRWELLPEAAVTGHSGTTVANGSLEMTVNQYQSAVVRITRGTGAGQERQVAGNTATVLTLGDAWTQEPDATSFFVIAENSWRTGNSGNSSPLTVDVPERIGSYVHISARAANASGEEAAYDLSPLTRWKLGNSGGLAADSAVPPAPTFVISQSPGFVNLSGIGFTSLENTTSIVAGTCTFHYYDEVNGTAIGLNAAVGSGDASIQFSAVVAAGSLVQLDEEIILAGATDSGGNTAVTRGIHQTAASGHLVATPVYPLVPKVVIVPFIKNFFGTPASGYWNYNLELPDVRIASVELYMTNSLGDGGVAVNQLTTTNDHGLRTLAGGQYSFQVTGYLAVQTGAAPNIIVDASRSIQDMYAVLRSPSSGAGVTLEINRNFAPYATIQFDPGATTSYVVPGFGLPPLTAGDQLGLDVNGVGTSNPGSDLTVVVRL